MRSLRIALSALLGATALSGVVLSAGAGAASNTLASCAKKVPAEEIHPGTLTVATDSPAYTPWFVANKPANGKGYEAAVAYAIANELGIARSDLKWVVEPFDSSYIPGPKSFDFDINEISYTGERAKAVTFSVSYYDVDQSIVALSTNPIVKKHTPKELKTYVYGDQIGTTGLAYINNKITPTTPAKVFSTLDQAVLALQTKQIDAIVIDTPTGQYMAADQITNKAGKSIATQVGQFPSTGEHYGLLFSKGNPLAACVNVALDAMKTNGTLAATTFTTNNQFGTGFGGQGVTGWTGNGGYNLFFFNGTATTISANSQYDNGAGTGSELRRPLGISIVGGLILSQVLTLYTTPVIYLYMEKLSRWVRRGQPAHPPLANQSAE